MPSNTRYYDRLGAPRQPPEERAAAGAGEILFGLVVERRSPRKTSETQSRS